MAKLPQEVRIQIARTNKKEIWDISEILDVILHEVEAREVSENVKINSEPQKPPANKYPSSAASSLLAQEAKPSTRANKELQAMTWKTPPVNLSHIETLSQPKG